MSTTFSHRFAILWLLAAPLAHGQAASAPTAPPALASASASDAADSLTDGVVERIDGPAVVTLRHQDIVNMQMPAMTMTFGVADGRMLARLKAGDRVRFRVEMVRNAPTIVRLELAGH